MTSGYLDLTSRNWSSKGVYVDLVLKLTGLYLSVSFFSATFLMFWIGLPDGRDVRANLVIFKFSWWTLSSKSIGSEPSPSLSVIAPPLLLFLWSLSGSILSPYISVTGWFLSFLSTCKSVMIESFLKQFNLAIVELLSTSLLFSVTWSSTIPSSFMDWFRHILCLFECVLGLFLSSLWDISLAHL